MAIAFVLIVCNSQCCINCKNKTAQNRVFDALSDPTEPKTCDGWVSVSHLRNASCRDSQGANECQQDLHGGGGGGGGKGGTVFSVDNIHINSKLAHPLAFPTATRAFERFILVVVKFPTPGPKTRSNAPHQGDGNL